MKTNRTKMTIAGVAMLMTVSQSSRAQDIRDEIEARVVERCAYATVMYEAWLRQGETGRRASRSAVDRMANILIESESSERLVESLLETVRGVGLESRMNLYDIAYVNCFLKGAERLFRESN